MNRTLLLLALFGCASAMAADPSSVNNANIQDTGVQYHGNFNVNQAAGDQMQQTNTKAIAIGTTASATTIVRQTHRHTRQSVDECQRHHWRQLFQ